MKLHILTSHLDHQYDYDTEFLDIRIKEHEDGVTVKVTTKYPPDPKMVRITYWEWVRKLPHWRCTEQCLATLDIPE